MYCFHVSGKKERNLESLESNQQPWSCVLNYNVASCGCTFIKVKYPTVQEHVHLITMFRSLSLQGEILSFISPVSINTTTYKRVSRGVGFFVVDFGIDYKTLNF